MADGSHQAEGALIEGEKEPSREGFRLSGVDRFLAHGCIRPVAEVEIATLTLRGVSPKASCF
jgi:hypothetical protein